MQCMMQFSPTGVESTNVGAGASAESIMTEIESLLVKKNLECNISTDLKKETE